MTTQMSNTALLPAGYSLRAASTADVPALTDLVNLVELAQIGHGNRTNADITGDWESAQFQLDQDTWIVLHDQQFIAYAVIYEFDKDGVITFDIYLHSDHYGRGLETLLLDRITARCAAHSLQNPDQPMRLRTYIPNDPPMFKLLEDQGYEVVRLFWRMEIDLTEAPPAVSPLPAGIQLRTMERGQDDYAIYEAVQISFEGQWNFTPFKESFEEWQHRKMDREDFDPTLWLLALDGDRIVGISLGHEQANKVGWITTLGMIPDYRQRGIATSLIQHHFREFYQRGCRLVGLGAEPANPTRAVQFYQRVGMHMAHEFRTYEKTLAKDQAETITH